MEKMDKKRLGFVLLIVGITLTTTSITLFRGSYWFYIVIIIAIVFLIANLIISINDNIKKK